MKRTAEQNSMKDIAVIGLGNMGVSVLCAALDKGLSGIGIDTDRAKTGELAAGRTVVPERDADTILAAALNEGRLQIGQSAAAAACARLVFIGVQTPAKGQNCDYTVLKIVLAELAKTAPFGQVIVIGSTVFPGAMKSEILPILASRPDLELVYEPVFLRAGFGIRDYQQPGKLVAGIRNPQQPHALLQELFARVVDETPRYVSYQEAEWIKMVHNAWMCVKISFANEIGALCADWGTDGASVINIAFGEGPRGRLLTLSHMLPGAPYSGPCLPKDAQILGGLLAASSNREWFQSGVCTALRTSNEHQRETLVTRWLDGARGSRKPLGVIGVAFRPEFNEVRSSLALDFFLAARASGQQVLAYDPAFEGISKPAYELAARQDQLVESLYESVVHPIEKVWAESSSVVINRKLTANELHRIALVGTQPSCIVDLYDNHVAVAAARNVGAAPSHHLTPAPSHQVAVGF
jgi:nucleotide sugar dehydrogenase